MQSNKEFSLAFNGPTLVVRQVDGLVDLEAGLYRRIIIAQDGLWYAELKTDHGKMSLEVDPEHNYDEYFPHILDSATKLIQALVYECCDLALVAISPQIGRHCAIVAPGSIYIKMITGGILPLHIAGAMYAPQQPTHYGQPITQPWFGRQAAEQMLYHRNSMNVKPAGFQSNKPLAATVVNIPHVTYDGVFTEHGGFLHWCSDARGHVTPMPVINPTISFDDRMLLENVLRIMIQNHQHSYPFGIVTPTYGYTSDDPEQHRFGTSEDPIHPL